MTDRSLPLTSQIPRVPRIPLTLSPSKGDDVASAWFDRLTMSGRGASHAPTPLTFACPAPEGSPSKGARVPIAGRRP